jgi:type I restriction enzyme M protein
MPVDGRQEERICSKIFNNRDFGFIKLVVERPLRLNFRASKERIARLWEQGAFALLAESKKRKDKKEIDKDVEEGAKEQAAIIAALRLVDADRVYTDRDAFKRVLDRVLANAGLKPSSAVYKAILTALSERDSTADICTDGKGDPEPDPELRDTESVPLPRVPLPLPIEYKGPNGKEPDNDAFVKLIRDHCDAYFAKEVKPHWPDAWIDYSKTKVGYEIPITRYFYAYQEPRPLEAIEADIRAVEREVIAILQRVN